MYSIKNLPEEVHSLREERGSGYETKDVLELLSSMMTELKALEECWQLKTWNKEFTRPEPYRKTRLRAARMLGYNVEDVQKLVKSLDDKIVQMRAKLGVERDKKNWNQEWQN
ncbi:hypothetical protein [Ruminococcus sp.]|uniref:hypothetical protein n=1 Tax=Ruminococcus sp. TaxID=41978 RepID=UPI0025FB41F1|nr:hypothetical protein [Ruminococcus sp.]MBQ8965946.1 hypothetical protein [Ruminococcus sp.]